MPTMRFEGELDPGVLIKPGTNPWLQAADEDEPFDLQEFAASIAPRGVLNNRGNCYQCYGCLVEGVIDAMDSPSGIQRCDTCDLYEGDLEAALALADVLTDFHVGALRFHVYFETYTKD